MNYELHPDIQPSPLPVSTVTSTARIGMLTPSSNTVLEPMTSAILQGLPVSAHYARLRVTEISVAPDALAQFNLQPMLDAAALLADARPNAVVWNGTSGGWVGFDADQRLVDTLQQQLGLAASTVTLSLRNLLKRQGIERIAFVTPYTDDVQARIIATFAADGFVCETSPCLGISENFAFSLVGRPELDTLVEQAAARRPEAIIPFCTNLPAAPHAERWEQQFGIPILDSVALAVRAGLELSGLPAGTVKGWGRVFEL